MILAGAAPQLTPYYLISRKEGWFNGFVWKHPGTEPRGHMAAEWNLRHAKPLEYGVLQQTKKDLHAMGIQDYIVHTVRIEPQHHTAPEIEL